MMLVLCCVVYMGVYRCWGEEEGEADYGSVSAIVWYVCMYVCGAAMCQCGKGVSVCEWV